MFAFQMIAEKRIREAMEEGLFKDLPGRGNPLLLEDDSHIPDELRLAYKILKNANCLPPELELKREILQLEDLMGGITDEKEKYRQMKRLNFLIMKLNTLRQVSPLLEEDQVYYPKLVEKFSQKG